MLRVDWIEKGDSYPTDGLLFEIDNLEAMFEKWIGVSCRLKTSYTLPNEQNDIVGIESRTSRLWEDRDPEIAVMFSGFDVPFGTLSRKCEPRVHHVGDVDRGFGRVVLEFVGLEYNLPVRAGLTIHKTYGSWSSHPCHEFERNMLMRPVGTHFDELFAVTTWPRGGWGMCPMVGHLNPQSDGDDTYGREIVLFDDRETIRMPLGYHPIVAGPGYLLAYFWCFQSNSTGFIEKFTHEGHN